MDTAASLLLYQFHPKGKPAILLLTHVKCETHKKILLLSDLIDYFSNQ